MNPQSYAKLDAEGNALPDSAESWAMVRDNVTGLIWEVKTDDGSIHDWDGKYNWEDAKSDFIAELNSTKFGGFSDWRMPKKEELGSIVNNKAYAPAVDTDYFPNTQMSTSYWSSTTYASHTRYAWCIDFVSGYDSYYYKSGTHYVRAVRGGQSG